MMRGLTPRPCAAYFAQTPRVSAAQARESRVVSGSLAPPRARRVRLAETRFGLGSQRGRFLARPPIAPIRMLTVIRIGTHLGGKPRAGLLLAAERGARSHSLRIRDHETPIFNFWCEGPDRPSTLTVETRL